MDQSLLITKYFKKNLSNEERQIFDDLLIQDNSFKKAVEEHKSLFRAFEINEAERLKKSLKELELKEDRPVKRLNIKKWFFPLAAIFFVLIGTSIYFNYFNTSLYDEYFEIYPNVYQPVVRGSTENTSKVFVLYENQKYLEAQKGFEELLNSEENPSIRFYYALTLLNQNKYEKASIEFEKLKAVDFEFLPEVYWYHALALLKLDKQEEAKELLQTMQTKDFSFNRDKVDKLLENL